MRIAVLAAGSFAVPSLRALSEHHDVVLVVTQPDRPAGRRGALQSPPAKLAAEALGLPVEQPERVNRPPAIERIRAVSPEVIVVADYGQLLRPSVFRLPPRGTINIHASLLPAYRGAAPVQWAIIRGETTTGVTTFLIDEGMDTGDLLLQRPLPIGPDETALELEARLAALGAQLILETLDGIACGALSPMPQPTAGISHAPVLTRDDGRIDWSRPAQQVHDLIRGTAPWPGAWTMLHSERVKVLRARTTKIGRGALPPGTVAVPESGRLLVATGDRLVEILEAQREGRRRVSGVDFRNGLPPEARFT